MNFITNELDKAITVFQAIRGDAQLLGEIERVGAMCSASINAGGKIMFCGNGGSAADSQHLAAELIGKLAFDRDALPGLALTVDSSALTAIGNDYGYELVFSRQVHGLGLKGDVLIGFSTSGRSKNVVRAMEMAKSKGIVTVAMTGATRGPMAEIADHWIAVPSTETQKIQEGHIAIGHIVCGLVEATIFKDRKTRP